MFDVLGKLRFEGKPLRDLLIEAALFMAPEACTHVRLLAVPDRNKEKILIP
jgi:hypothetical protein